jgi:uracil-DNA glycosylase
MSDKEKLLTELYSVIKNCKTCELHKSRQQALPGEGNPEAKLFLVALAPGEQEDREGRMFIGSSGKMLDDLLENAKVNRNELYISNLIKCNLPQNRKPKMIDIESCHNYLDEEINIINPEFIVTLGFYASRYILEKYKYHAPRARADYHELYGKLVYADGQKIYLLPHPACLLYKPEYLAATQSKYNKLRILGTKCKWYSLCPMRKYFMSGRILRFWVELYCHGDWQNCRRFQMEKNGESHPDNMMPDGTIDDGLKN